MVAVGQGQEVVVEGVEQQGRPLVVGVVLQAVQQEVLQVVFPWKLQEVGVGRKQVC